MSISERVLVMTILEETFLGGLLVGITVTLVALKMWLIVLEMVQEQKNRG